MMNDKIKTLLHVQRAGSLCGSFLKTYGVNVMTFRPAGGDME